MPLKSDGEGCYTATWVPATSGKYIIQVFIDNKHTGMYAIAVLVCYIYTCILVSLLVYVCVKDKRKK